MASCSNFCELFFNIVFFERDTFTSSLPLHADGWRPGRATPTSPSDVHIRTTVYFLFSSFLFLYNILKLKCYIPNVDQCLEKKRSCTMPNNYILRVGRWERKACKIMLILKTRSGNIVHVDKWKYIVCEFLHGSHVCRVIWMGGMNDSWSSLTLWLDFMHREDGRFPPVEQI